MQIEITTRHYDDADRAVELDYVGEISCAQINQLLAGEIGPSAIVPGFYNDDDVVSWEIMDGGSDYAGHGWMHSGVSIAA
jgi:hypothetical protein